MAAGPKVLYEFGPFRVDPDKQALLRDDKPVPLTPKAFDTLLTLIRNSREIVSKDELMKAVWPDAFVEENNLSQNIFMLRKALGDVSGDRHYIVTLPGRGYRFAAEVRTVMQEGDDVVIKSHLRSQVVVEQIAADRGAWRLGAAERRTRPRWMYLFAVGVVVTLAGIPALLLR